jgi:hypothetical protein
VHRVLVSLLDFKSSVACQKRAGWVRFPHAPARTPFSLDELCGEKPSIYRGQIRTTQKYSLVDVLSQP